MFKLVLILGTLAIICGVLRGTESPESAASQNRRARWRSILANTIDALVFIVLVSFPTGDNSAKGWAVAIGISLLAFLHFFVLQIIVGKLIRRMKGQPPPVGMGSTIFGKWRGSTRANL